ncbi:uncharacterized protein Gasu_22220 [Galdieria sulphuraria]|uniref:K Homology domain-containing protein n=1 Tax=Galdieria sulphuraria TaxID=130081 RepID=M2XK85_GALSU|nr:uncharacterized protein Gasu_22220 [Galdieria sulphuraria]EME30552.1 hypothetical protein Gasu_22220 [Galdieria sulphuraria]|eukprot:XP_005707072.1 hypothetical protein Gasu_22220 [Galdieria sulphuraria]
MTGHSLFGCIDALYQREVEATFSLQFVDPGSIKNPSDSSSVQLGSFWSPPPSSSYETTQPASMNLTEHIVIPTHQDTDLMIPNNKGSLEFQNISNSMSVSSLSQNTERQQPIQMRLHGNIAQVLRLIRLLTVPNSTLEMTGTVTFSLKLNEEEQKYLCESDEKTCFRWIVSRSAAAVHLECASCSGESSHIIISGKFECVIKAYDLVAELLDPQKRGKHPLEVENKSHNNEVKHSFGLDSTSEFPAVWLTLQESSLADPFSSRQQSPVSRQFSDWIVPPSLVHSHNLSHHHSTTSNAASSHTFLSSSAPSPITSHTLSSMSHTNNKKDEIISRSLPISADLGGVVVGRGGTMINRVRRDFGVEVDINPGETSVRLRGPKSAVDAAFRFYEKKLEHALRKRGEFHISPTQFSEETESLEGGSASCSPFSLPNTTTYSHHPSASPPHSIPSWMPVNDSQFDDGFAGDRNLFGEILPNIRHRHW